MRNQKHKNLCKKNVHSWKGVGGGERNLKYTDATKWCHIIIDMKDWKINQKDSDITRNIFYFIFISQVAEDFLPNSLFGCRLLNKIAM